MAPRRWYQLHWLTWLALFAMLGPLIWLQRHGQRLFNNYSRIGWPLGVVNPQSDGYWVPQGFLVPLTVDLAVAAIALASTALVVESWRRSAWQLRLSSLFWLTAITGLVFAARKQLDESGVQLIWQYPLAVDVALSVALGCSVYAAGALALHLVGRRKRAATPPVATCPVRRRWFQLHWLTWLAQAAMLGTWTWLQHHGHQLAQPYDIGWPLGFSDESATGYTLAQPFLLPFVLDLAFLAVSLAATAFVIESWRRRVWQPSVSSLCWLTGITGLVFIARKAIGELDIQVLWHYPLPVDIALSLALGCALYAAAVFPLRLLGRKRPACSPGTGRTAAG